MTSLTQDCVGASIVQLTYGRKSTSSSAISLGMSVKPSSGCSESWNKNILYSVDPLRRSVCVLWGTQTLSSMATKLVNCDRMEYSLLNSMMKDFSSSFLPWNTETVSAKTRERPGFACDSKPRVLLRRSPGFRPRNPLWWLWLWACEETACMYQRSFDALEGGGQASWGASSSYRASGFLQLAGGHQRLQLLTTQVSKKSRLQQKSRLRQTSGGRFLDYMGSSFSKGDPLNIS